MPPIGARALIWVSSLLVQGAWLLWLISEVIHYLSVGRPVVKDIANIFTVWWVFATVASFVGLAVDLPRQDEPEITPDMNLTEG